MDLHLKLDLHPPDSGLAQTNSLDGGIFYDNTLALKGGLKERGVAAISVWQQLRSLLDLAGATEHGFSE